MPPEGDSQRGLSPELKTILIAAGLCAFLGPGAGQIYNRRRLKGVLMILSTLGLIAGLGAYMVMAAKRSVEQTAQTNPQLLFVEGAEIMLAKTIVMENMRALQVFKWSFVVLWCYGIVDAYRDAKERTSTKSGGNV
ncbi:MAG: hypothetical protein HYT79_04495 [Elusimicrobia bacterium]|nr:hypothetical protein [Elusimicrobiota bacterium]